MWQLSLALFRWAMNRLKELPWWPTDWTAKTGKPCTDEEINRSGILMNVRRSRNTLTFLVDHNGTICSATVTARVSEDSLIFLRHILLQQCGYPMEVVGDLGIDLHEMFQPAK